MTDSEKHLHIISFDIPFPANYGGVIDVFYRIKYLSECGMKIHLHCYEYGRNHCHPKELDNLCFSVDYYDRVEGFGKMFSRLPYIVNTRCSKQLADNLAKDTYPIFIEGLHCCMLLNEPRLKGRRMYVRMHNVEHDYYSGLSKVETNWLKRLYLKLEVPRLRRFEAVLSKATGIFAITPKDMEYFSAGYRNVHLLPPSLRQNNVCSKVGSGTYVLFHGQLSVPENYDAVKYLAKEVFAHTSLTLKVAGLNPPKHLERLLSNYANIELIKNPSDNEMTNLVQNAHVNLLLTKQSTGLKLKLLNSLFNGRFCVVNETMVEGTNLGNLCILFDKPSDLVAKLEDLFTVDFKAEELQRREVFFQKYYSNIDSGRTIVENIYSNTGQDVDLL